MIAVSRRYRFCASHRLHVSTFTDAQNDELFGKCNNPFGHGHNYEIEVTAKGEIDPASGRAVDIRALDALVFGTIVARYDHKNLNSELPEFEKAVPTTENLAREIRAILEDAWPTAFRGNAPRLERIRIFETERNIFEVAAYE